MAADTSIDYEKVFKEHPQLREIVDSLIRLVQSGEIENAHDAEELVINDTRNLGKEILNSWASRQAEKKAEDVRQHHEGARKHGKKNSTGTPHLEK